MLFKYSNYLVKEFLIQRIRSQHRSLHCRLLGEILLQLTTVIHQIVTTEYQQTRIKRFRDVIICSDFQSFQILFYFSTSRQQHYRNVTGIQVSFQLLHQLNTRHARHQHVAQYNMRRSLLYLFQRILPVDCSRHFIHSLEQLGQHTTNRIVIFYNQDVRTEAFFFSYESFFCLKGFLR